MTTVAMKKKIISKIEQTQSKDLLSAIHRLIEVNDETEEVFKLSEEQKTSVKKGLRQVAQKKTISNTKANKEVEKWLSK